jgi:hypothetical protein
MLNFLKDAKILAVENAAAAGTSLLTTEVVDMQGFDSVCFVVKLGDVTDTCELTLTAKTNTADSTSSPAPTVLSDTVTFTAGASDADNKLLMLDLHKPRDRYVFATLARATANAVVDGIFAILYNAHERPVTQDASVIASAFANDPA